MKKQSTLELPVAAGRQGKKPTRLRLRPGKPTGPRTNRGKDKSRYNSLKHGILAVALLPGESRSEYEAILQGLIDHLQPAGQLEELLVEKLAILWWRYRRLLQAESAEIQQTSLSQQEFLERPSVFGASLYPKEKCGLLGSGLLARELAHLLKAGEHLRDLRKAIARQGFDWNRDEPVLRLVYGKLVEDVMKRLAPLTAPPSARAELEEEPDGAPVHEEQETTEEGNVEDFQPDEDESQADPRSQDPSRLSPDSENDFLARYRFAWVAAVPGREVPRQEKRELLHLLDQQIDFCQRELDKGFGRKVIRERLSEKIVGVPSGDAAERLQRYEASLERAIDRTLGQLERLQRLRMGQPVPPTLKVDVNR